MEEGAEAPTEESVPAHGERPERPARAENAPARPAPAKEPAPPRPNAAPVAPDGPDATLGRVLTLLGSLPREAPPEMKRALVEASLQAFGVRIESVLESGQAALASLDELSARTTREHDEGMAEANARIHALEAEITRLRRGMADAQGRKAAHDADIAAEKEKLVQALDFFGAPVAVAPTKPRLVRLA